MFVLLIIALTLLQPTYGQLAVREFANLSTDRPEIQSRIIKYHNEYRRDVDPPAQNMLQMSWDDDLKKFAQEFAAMCTCNHSSFKYRTRNGTHFGENILASPVPAVWKNVTDCWYNERFSFEYGKKPNATVGHLTQMIWGPTDKCGCAIANCPNTSCEYFYVCMYHDVGNLDESPNTPYMQGTTCGKCPDNCVDKLCQVACNMRNNSTLQSCETVKERKECYKYPAQCQGSCNCPEGTVYQ